MVVGMDLRQALKLRGNSPSAARFEQRGGVGDPPPPLRRPLAQPTYYLKHLLPQMKSSDTHRRATKNQRDLLEASGDETTNDTSRKQAAARLQTRPPQPNIAHIASAKMPAFNKAYHLCRGPFSQEKGSGGRAGASLRGGQRANSCRKGSHEKGNGERAGKRAQTRGKSIIIYTVTIVTTRRSFSCEKFSKMLSLGCVIDWCRRRPSPTWWGLTWARMIPLKLCAIKKRGRSRS